MGTWVKTRYSAASVATTLVRLNCTYILFYTYKQLYFKIELKDFLLFYYWKNIQWQQLELMIEIVDGVESFVQVTTV